MSKLFLLLSCQSFNATDTILQTVKTWPNLKNVDFFESKLKFQIQHSIFRTKVNDQKSISPHENEAYLVVACDLSA